MDLTGIKHFVAAHPWEATGIGGGLAVLFFVIYRHNSGSAPVSALAALSPAQQLAAMRIQSRTQLGLAEQQQLAATLPTKYTASAQTSQAGIMARMQDFSAGLSSKLGLANIAATLKMSPTGTQVYGLGLDANATSRQNVSAVESAAQIASMYGNQGYGGNAGYGYNSGYGYASPYGYTPAYQNPSAYLGGGGIGGLLSSIGGLFGGGGGSSSGTDYGGGGTGAYTGG